MMYKLLYTKRALKDIKKLRAARLADKAKELCELLTKEATPRQSKQLLGDLKGKHSIRINVKHRLVYQIEKDTKYIKILSMWSHYDDN